MSRSLSPKHKTFFDTTIVIDGVEMDVIVRAEVIDGIPGWQWNEELGPPEIESLLVFESTAGVLLDVSGYPDLIQTLEEEVWEYIERGEYDGAS